MSNPPNYASFGSNDQQGYLTPGNGEGQQNSYPHLYSDPSNVNPTGHTLSTVFQTAGYLGTGQNLDEPAQAVGLRHGFVGNSHHLVAAGDAVYGFLDDDLVYAVGTRQAHTEPVQGLLQQPIQLPLEGYVYDQQQLQSQVQQQQQQQQQQHGQILSEQLVQGPTLPPEFPGQSLPLHDGIRLFQRDVEKDVGQLPPQEQLSSQQLNEREKLDCEKMAKRSYSDISAGEGPSSSRQSPHSPTSYRQGMRTAGGTPSTLSNNHYAASQSPSMADSRSNTNTYSSRTRQRSHFRQRPAPYMLSSMADVPHSVIGINETNITSPSEQLYGAKSMGDNTSNFGELDDYPEPTRGQRAYVGESMDMILRNISGRFSESNTTANSRPVRNPSTNFGRRDATGITTIPLTSGTFTGGMLLGADSGNLRSIHEYHHSDAGGYAGTSSSGIATVRSSEFSEPYGVGAYGQYGQFGSSSATGMQVASHGADHYSRYGPTDHNVLQDTSSYFVASTTDTERVAPETVSFDDSVSTHDPKGKGKARDTAHDPSASSGGKSGSKKDRRVLLTATTAKPIQPKPDVARTPSATPNPRYRCSQCSAAFEAKKLLNKHVNKEHADIPCPCEVFGCTKTFHLRSEAKRHVNTLHAKWYVFYCRHVDCHELGPFSRDDQLRQHLKKKHRAEASTHKRLMETAAADNTPYPTCIACRYEGCDQRFVEKTTTRKNGEVSVKTSFGLWFDHYVDHHQGHGQMPLVDFYVGDEQYDFLAWWRSYNLVERSEDGKAWTLAEEAKGNERRRGRGSRGQSSRQAEHEDEQQSEHHDGLEDQLEDQLEDDDDGLYVYPDPSFEGDLADAYTGESRLC